MATIETEEWTEEQCIQLIREFRARPELWDPKSPFYFKKKRKDAAWAAIGEVINRLPYKCKHKMGVLMSSFRREKARIMNSIQEGDPSKFYTSNWFGFKDMTFLIDKEGERKRRFTGGSGNSNAKNEKNGKSTALNNQLVQLCSAQQSANVTPAPQMPAPSQRTTESDDEVKAFTNFIASKMKKYSETTKNAVQQAICEIIFKADLRYFENTNCDSPSTSQSPHPSGSRQMSITNDDIIRTIIVKQESDDLSPEEIEIEHE